MPKEQQPVKVPSAQQAGAVPPEWLWVKPCAWSIRMLDTLIKGIEGGVWFRLFDKVFAERTLLAAFQQVMQRDGAAGVDHISPDDFAQKLPDSIWELSDMIKEGRFIPQAIKRVEIPKPGTNETRPLGIPTVRDRVVQTAIVYVIEPIFEREFAKHSYGFRPNRGCKDALRRVDQLMDKGHVFVVDADLKGYFDSIPHDKLMKLVSEKIKDGKVLGLIEQFLKAKIMSDAQTWTPERGAPQGAVLSPLLSNIYLNPLDHQMNKRGYEMVRYADDFVVLCKTREEAEAALAEITAWVEEAGLTLHPTKTKIVDATKEGFAFLGYEFKGKSRQPRDKSLKKFKETIRGKTRRTNGEAMQSVIADLNQTLRGWFEYYKHTRPPYRFGSLDGWIRMRLRSILRKRQKKRGRSCNHHDHKQWPNKFFADLGLFSLKAAWEVAVQSSPR